MKRIAIISNAEKEGAEAVAASLMEHFSGKCEIYKEDNCFGEALSRKADVAVVLGGDGTILRAAKMCKSTPILGVNFGTLGYMTAVEKDGAKKAIESVLCGDYSVEERMMLDVTVTRNGTQIAKALALNDGVITRSERILSLKEYFGERLVYSFSGDGIIVATPTGSTAYSLSAGGPVTPPDTEVIITTPVCPHSIHIRPVIASAETSVRVVIENMTKNAGMLNVDGQNICTLENGDEVTFCRSDKKAKLVFLEQKNFYDVLRYKLSFE